MTQQVGYRSIVGWWDDVLLTQQVGYRSIVGWWDDILLTQVVDTDTRGRIQIDGGMVE